MANSPEKDYFQNKDKYEIKKIKKIKDIHKLIDISRELISKKDYQSALSYLERALTLEPENLEIIDLLGFVHFSLTNYSLSKVYNEKALTINPRHAYAYKGLGLCFARLGEVEKGIRLLYHAIELGDPTFTEPYYDLALILWENSRITEALHVLGVGRNLSRKFKEKTETLYISLVENLEKE